MDKNSNGTLSLSEFGELVKHCGLPFDDDLVRSCFDKYDTDGNGTIGLDETLVFLRQQLALIKHVHTNLTSNPCYCITTNPNVRYVPPAEGRVLITVVDGFHRKPIFRTMSAVDRDNIHALAVQSSDRIALTWMGATGCRLAIGEAGRIYQTMLTEARSKNKVVSSLLPQLLHPTDARLFISRAFQGDLPSILSYRRRAGSALRPLIGIINGFYSLDLSIPSERLCLTRLLEISTTSGMPPAPCPFTASTVPPPPKHFPRH